jgi:predicted phage terminase large subunit-like protein
VAAGSSALEADAAELLAIEAELARRRLRTFVEVAWPLVEPERPFVPNWHIDALCDVLEAVTRGDLKRVIVNISPGSMKSLLVSVLWPAWEWASNPSLRYLTASYSAPLTIRDNLRLRAIVASPWFRQHYGVRLVGDQNDKVRFNTTASGWRIASSVGGVGTGEHPDRIIIDDPITAAQAKSDAERTSANEWFDRTISSRGVTRDVRIVVVMQRLHEEDLSGHLLKKGGWEWVCWPMRYEVERPDPRNPKVMLPPDPRDPRTEAGALFWPALFPEAVVRQLEYDLGPYGAAGQLQQRPSPEGGGLFQRGWFPVVDAVPAGAQRLRGWDTAGTEGGGDWTVGVKLASHQGVFYVEHVHRGQWGPGGVDREMLAIAQQDGRAVAQREEKEGGSAGKAVVQARAKLLVGFDYRGESVTGDKVTRAKPFRAQCEAGNVRLVRGDWNETYLQELEGFPMGKHDDQVDASSCAFNALALRPQIRTIKVQHA